MAKDYILFIQRETDRELDKVGFLLGKDPKVERLEWDSVNHYSVPDSIDMAERFMLRVYPKDGQYEAPREGLLDRIRQELGDHVADEINLVP